RSACAPAETAADQDSEQREVEESGWRLRHWVAPTTAVWVPVPAQTKTPSRRSRERRLGGVCVAWVGRDGWEWGWYVEGWITPLRLPPPLENAQRARFTRRSDVEPLHARETTPTRISDGEGESSRSLVWASNSPWRSRVLVWRGCKRLGEGARCQGGVICIRLASSPTITTYLLPAPPPRTTSSWRGVRLVSTDLSTPQERHEGHRTTRSAAFALSRHLGPRTQTSRFPGMSTKGRGYGDESTSSVTRGSGSWVGWSGDLSQGPPALSDDFKSSFATPSSLRTPPMLAGSAYTPLPPSFVSRDQEHELDDK
ncbi:LOW QUALITY PROTEIN: hypothetical protein CVT26_006785, partial [Gymnopilus dilepis]